MKNSGCWTFLGYLTFLTPYFMKKDCTKWDYPFWEHKHFYGSWYILPNFFSELLHLSLLPPADYERISFIAFLSAKYIWIFKHFPNRQKLDVIFILIWISLVRLYVFMYACFLAEFSALFYTLSFLHFRPQNSIWNGSGYLCRMGDQDHH